MILLVAHLHPLASRNYKENSLSLPFSPHSGEVYKTLTHDTSCSIIPSTANVAIKDTRVLFGLYNKNPLLHTLLFTTGNLNEQK